MTRCPALQQGSSNLCRIPMRAILAMRVSAKVTKWRKRHPQCDAVGRGRDVRRPEDECQTCRAAHNLILESADAVAKTAILLSG
mmetsp:Transcript_16934/g.24880  ORF Transcript_16934/g.24880 Transcript_16934/m.24880 type:complete len:84 (-) Transcript_16934:152-403(-)